MHFSFLSGISEDQNLILSLVSPIIWQRSSGLQLPWVKIHGLLVLLFLQALQRNLLQAQGQSWALSCALCEPLHLTQPQVTLQSPFLQQQFFSSILPGSLGHSFPGSYLSHPFSRHRGQTQGTDIPSVPLPSPTVLLLRWTHRRSWHKKGSYKDFLPHIRWARLTKINPLLLTGVPTS